MIKSLTRTALSAFILASFTLAATQANAANDRFKKVLDRGKLVVGVKADYKPWGFRDPSGKLVGMEIDMAQDVADALGVTLDLVPVQSSNRMQFLQQGKIDLMIATMSDKANRRKVVGIPQPNYYTSGTNVLAKKGVVKSWSDLAGKPVCGKQGAFYNKQVSKSTAPRSSPSSATQKPSRRCATASASPGCMTIPRSWRISPPVNTTPTKCPWRPRTTRLGASPCRKTS